MSTTADVVVVGAGGLGSATAWQLARRGIDVMLLEQFAFGHSNGASHDTSRILRRSYHTPAYVTLAGEAYADWAELERESGERLVTTTGGLDLFPPGGTIPASDYTSSLSACDVPFDTLDVAEVSTRWPAFSLPTGTVSLYQKDTAIVPAGRGTATMQRLARQQGARLHDQSPVTGLRDLGDGVEVTAGELVVRAARVVLTADAWTNDLLGHLDTSLPLTVLREQVTYFQPAAPSAYGPDRLPVWIWMDDPNFYGFPTYAEGGHGARVKAAQDCGGKPTTASTRSFDPDAVALDRLTDFVSGLLPGIGRSSPHGHLPLHPHPRPRLRDRRGARSPVGLHRTRRRPQLQVRPDHRPHTGRAGNRRHHHQRHRRFHNGSAGAHQPELPAHLGGVTARTRPEALPASGRRAAASLGDFGLGSLPSAVSPTAGAEGAGRGLPTSQVSEGRRVARPACGGSALEHLGRQDTLQLGPSDTARCHRGQPRRWSATQPPGLCGPPLRLFAGAPYDASCGVPRRTAK